MPDKYISVSAGSIVSNYNNQQKGKKATTECPMLILMHFLKIEFTPISTENQQRNYHDNVIPILHDITTISGIVYRNNE